MDISLQETKWTGDKCRTVVNTNKDRNGVEIIEDKSLKVEVMGVKRIGDWIIKSGRRMGILDLRINGGDSYHSFC